jgi:hypothetical protein
MRDVIVILRVQGSQLDRQHPEHWAKDLHVEELLAAALCEVE